MARELARAWTPRAPGAGWLGGRRERLPAGRGAGRLGRGPRDWPGRVRGSRSSRGLPRGAAGPGGGGARRAGTLRPREGGSPLPRVERSPPPHRPSPPTRPRTSGTPPPRLLFQGREGVHAVQAVGRSGRRRYVPVHRPIAREDWEAHFRGEATLALPLVRAGEPVSWASSTSTSSAVPWRSPAPPTTCSAAPSRWPCACHELSRRGCGSLLEASGAKGYHVWIRLAEPAPCFRLRRFLLDVVRAIGALPEAVRVEELPNRDHVRDDVVGPLVKLPLGVHPKTGRRCSSSTSRGSPSAEPFAALRELPRVPVGVLERRRSPRARPRRPVPSPPSAPAAPQSSTAATSSATSSGKRGTPPTSTTESADPPMRARPSRRRRAPALHAIIAHTYNYSAATTDRHIDRLPEWPMSCPKVRELHPEAAAVARACSCRFDLRGRGYPTPAPRPRPAGDPRLPRPVGGTRGPGEGGRDRRRGVGPQPPPPGGGGPPRQAERAQAPPEGIEASLARVVRDSHRLFDAAASDELEVALGHPARRAPEAGEVQGPRIP